MTFNVTIKSFLRLSAQCQESVGYWGVPRLVRPGPFRRSWSGQEMEELVVNSIQKVMHSFKLEARWLGGERKGHQGGSHVFLLRRNHQGRGVRGGP